MDHILSLCQTLVRSVVRAFYTTQEILVVEALVTHKALRDDELAYLMKMNLKDLHRLCATLREARFLVVHTRPEMQAGKTRPINRTYYWIDYQQTVDAIKWRVYKTDKDMQGIAQPQDESKEYFCPHCKAQWTQMEVLDSVSSRGFTCQRCDSVLERSKEEQAPGHQQLSRMNNQFMFMTNMLQEIDKGSVPECTFDKAIAIARPIVREATHEVLASIPVDTGLNKPSAVKGLANTGPKTMQVTISDGNEEQENIENRKRKERMLRENALPSWITDSSVAATSIGSTSNTTISFEMADVGDEDSQPSKRVKLEDSKQDVKVEMSFKMEDEEEDDLEFEDVV
ncbi:transcription initiation factor IIE subunit alpha [Podospora australis]|uniref:Transcription initiation factor IIE subunit alpha n=1 Tax=Podospora australis TaxID=1536484 RepID=A0AAN6X3Y4_9PEZI|nr:transcription initiation factor IIE subunit alpha [Podospora australis]